MLVVQAVIFLRSLRPGRGDMDKKSRRLSRTCVVSIVIYAWVLTSTLAVAQQMRVQTQFPSSPQLRQYFDILTSSFGATAVSIAPIGSFFDFLKQGRLDAGWMLPSVWDRTDLAFGAIEAMPLVLRDEAFFGWRASSQVVETVDRIYSQRGAKGLLCGAVPETGGLWTKDPLPLETKLLGLRLRVVESILSSLLAGAGAVPSAISAGETLPAMQLSIIDGAIGLTAQEDLRLGYSQAAKYYYVTHFYPVRGIDLVLSLKTWEALSPDGKRTLLSGCENLTARMFNELTVLNRQTIQRMKAEGVVVSPLPPEIEEELRKISETIYDRLSTRSSTLSILVRSAMNFAPDLKSNTGTDER